MAQTAQHTTIDGSTVTIEARSLDPGRHASSVGVYAIDGRWHEFTASYRAFGADVAADLGVRLVASYRFQGGTLRLGSTVVRFPATPDNAPQRDLLHLGVWEGRDFSVHSHLYNGSAHDLVPIFEHFEFFEEASGAFLRPRDPLLVPPIKEPLVLRDVPGAGLLQVMPLTPRVARTVPRWKGTPVAGGELFVGRRRAGTHFVLVGPRSHTLVMRDGSDCSKEDLSVVAALNVDWRPTRS